MTPSLAPGVPLTLARHRAATIRDVAYDLTFTIPAGRVEPVQGEVSVRFTLDPLAASRGEEVALDFGGDGSALTTLRVNGVACVATLVDEHIALPASALRPGVNEVRLAFVAGTLAINRQPGLVYSLFVPARARLAFPCFDQPDLKARFTVTLDLPAGWTGVSNGRVVERRSSGGAGAERTRVRFAETPPLPTYLLAFVAGELEEIELQAGGRHVGMFVRPDDAPAARAAAGTIAMLHDAALRYVEAYTAVPYPWDSCDIVLIPSFQFSGMEHAGAIYYHAQRLLLDATATQHDLLARASLIAHEVAHLWFGDFVTMRWFDDVWLKEVFASFMADKVVSTLFPGQAHDLRFFLGHYPEAYANDRAAGANPVRQPLENLRDAGQVYGPSIYQKAPIVWRQLEQLMGEAPLRDAVRAHLARHPFGSAAWPDLLDDLQRHATFDLASWSRAWLDEPGRPRLIVESAGPDVAAASPLRLVGADARGRGLAWVQPVAMVDAAGATEGRAMCEELVFDGHAVPVPPVLSASACLLPNGSGVSGALAYGRTELLPAHRAWLLAQVEAIDDARVRGVAWLTLWDDLLEGEIDGEAFVTTAVRALPVEREQLIADALLGWVARAFWRFVSPARRPALAVTLETTLRAGLDAAATPSARAAWFRALRAVALTDATCDWLARIWSRTERIDGLPLHDADELQLACELALRGRGAVDVLATQRARMRDAERTAYLDVLAPALSHDAADREQAFARLAHHEHRRREPWALAVLRALNHPLRETHARQFIGPGLRLLPELQRTGDIFFPMRWADALLSGHASREAADAVRAVLAVPFEDGGLSPRLHRTVLNAADELFRAARQAAR